MSNIIAQVPIAELDQLRKDSETLKEMINDRSKYWQVIIRNERNYSTFLVPIDQKQFAVICENALNELSKHHSKTFDEERDYFSRKKAQFNQMIEMVSALYEKQFPKKDVR